MVHQEKKETQGKDDVHVAPVEVSGADILDNKVNTRANLHPSITDSTSSPSPDVSERPKACDEERDTPSDLPRKNSRTSTTSANSAKEQNLGHNRSARQPKRQTKSDSSSSTPPRKLSVDESASTSRNTRRGSVSRRYKRTACFVHSLLEVQQRFEKTNLGSMPPSEASSRPGSPTGREAHDAAKYAAESKKELFTHLSKKEISDMALGVRELSKHLGSARLKLNIHRILIVTKTGDKSLVPLLVDLTTWLLSRKKERSNNNNNHHHHNPSGAAAKDDKPQGYTVYVEKTFENEESMAKLHAKSNPGKLKYWTSELCSKSPQLFDFVITLGGDGTVLYTSWLFQKIVPPVLSFALGSLGFLTPFDFKNHTSNISGVFQDGVTAALRMRVECQIYRAQRNENGELLKDHADLHEDLTRTDNHGEDTEPNHSPDECFTILNDLVVDRGPNPFMSSTELYGDDEHMTSIAADGVVISTPTGSTAYSLSAGGSLCHPEIPAILISPICPHTLSFRPLLVPDSMVLRVAVPYDSRSTAWASFDGRNRTEIKQGDYVRISASRFPFPTVLRGRQTGDWFESISRTLNWNERKKQKSV